MSVTTFEKTVFTSKPTFTKLDQSIPVTHALDLLRNCYENILIRTCDTDVLNLLISYLSQFQLDDVNIYAHDKL